MDKKLFLIIFIVLVPFFLILFSYKVVFGFSGYDEWQQEVVDFLKGKTELKIYMAGEERSHLEDVKGVVKKVDYVFYFLLLVFTLVFTYGYKDKSYLRKLLLYGGISSLGLVILFLVLGLFSFDFLFTVFHQLFFPQGNWMFLADSFLIQTFPLSFFVSMAKKIVLLSLFLASIFILGSFLIKRKRV